MKCHLSKVPPKQLIDTIVSTTANTTVDTRKANSMNSSIICTFVGPDKPGLIEGLAQVVKQCHGNWLESSMAQLAGQFAGIVRIDIDSNKLSSLTEQLKRLESKGLLVQIQQGDPDKRNVRSPKLDIGSQLSLLVVGNDRPGIIHEVSQALASAGLNVTKMATHLSSAPMSGDILFHAEIVLENPDSKPVEELESRLDMIAEQLSIEIDLDVSGQA